GMFFFIPIKLHKSPDKWLTENLNVGNFIILLQISTDGLILRGYYTTLTIAVYGHLFSPLAENVADDCLPHNHGLQNGTVLPINSSNIKFEKEEPMDVDWKHTEVLLIFF